MKKIASILLILTILISCNKDQQNDIQELLIPENEVPVWLKTNIVENIQNKSTIIAWIRYSWQNAYYFEKDDLTSSSSYSIPVSYNGEKLNNNDLYKRYQAEKCCQTYVWKSPGYSDIFNRD